MAETELTNLEIGQVETVSELLMSSVELDIAFAIMIAGLIIIFTGYYKFSNWVRGQKFRYKRPHVSQFVRVGLLPFFAIALITTTNTYIQTFELFVEEELLVEQQKEGLTPQEVFAKLLNTINILVIGWTISHLVPIALNKHDKKVLEGEDYNAWFEMRGFPDDEGDLFHKCFKWIPPKKCPNDLSEEEFQKNLQTKEGLDFLENFHTLRGLPIGSYKKLVKNPYELWKQSERKKYDKYYKNCITGNNQTGQKLTPGAIPEEIYPIDVWREQKRISGYKPLIPSARPPGYAQKQREGVPRSAKQILPIGIFVVTVIAVLTWWEVDLVVLATATGGLGIGVGFALKDTIENYFAYILIRKDKVIKQGERIKLPSGYNGYVYKITPRITYIRHGLNESVATIPTRELVSAEIINYTKEFPLVPAVIEVGVSYLNNPRQVKAVLIKIGKRAIVEVKDKDGNHLARQKRCPYLDENKASCGCDQNIHVNISGPVVRFNKFNDSSLDFALFVYVRDYGSSFRMKSEMRIIMYEEFKKYDIRIPWPIRTVYQGDEKREEKEIGQLDGERNKLIDEHGKSIEFGGTEDE